jgi:hypothetical protein
MNATESSQRFHIDVEGVSGMTVASETDITVDSTQARWVPVRVQVPYDAAPSGSHVIHFTIEATGVDAKISEKSVFIIPR